MQRILSILATVTAMVTGFLVTLSLLLDGTGTFPALLAGANIEAPVRALAPWLIQLVATTVALTIIIGLVNLLGVHFVRGVRFRGDAILSLLLVISALGVIVVNIMERTGALAAPDGGPTYTAVLRNTVQFSVEASLAGLLAFSLVYGAVQFSRRKITLETVVFLIALEIGLLARANINLPGVLEDYKQSIINAGAQGILLSIALATLVAGVRVLIGQDRSYRE